MAADHTIYVYMLNEGANVWRPVQAAHVSGLTYRILGSMPDGESWRYLPGEIVRCEERVFAQGMKGMAAVSRAG